MKTLFGIYNEEGYAIWFGQAGDYEVVYSAGNSPHDSQQTVPVDHPSAVSLTDLKAWCIQTGKEMAEEYEVEFTGATYEAMERV